MKKEREMILRQYSSRVEEDGSLRLPAEVTADLAVKEFWLVCGKGGVSLVPVRAGIETIFQELQGAWEDGVEYLLGGKVVADKREVVRLGSWLWTLAGIQLGQEVSVDAHYVVSEHFLPVIAIRPAGGASPPLTIGLKVLR